MKIINLIINRYYIQNIYTYYIHININRYYIQKLIIFLNSHINDCYKLFINLNNRDSYYICIHMYFDIHNL